MVESSFFVRMSIGQRKSVGMVMDMDRTHRTRACVNRLGAALFSFNSFA